MAEQQASPVFNAQSQGSPAAEKPAQTDFEKSLKEIFRQDPAIVSAVTDALKKLQVPLPENAAQYLRGQDGLLLFFNTHGVILRIEKRDGEGYEGARRAPDSAWMLQPLGTVQAGAAVIEILPGVNPEQSNAESRKLYWKLWADGYVYWDERLDNAGRLPLTSPQFPEGVPVVIDRMSVAKLTSSTQPLVRAMEMMKGPTNRASYRSPINDPAPDAQDLRAEFRQMMAEMLGPKPDKFDNKYDQEGYAAFLTLRENVWPEGTQNPHHASAEEIRLPLHRAMNALTRNRMENSVKSREALGAEDPQEILYGPLRRAFTAAWPTDAPGPDAGAMAAFWREALAFRQAGKLVCGWNELIGKDDGTKFTKAPKAALAYEPLAARIGAGASPAPVSQAPVSHGPDYTP